MSKIPTAEEKLKANFYNGSFIEINSGDFEDIKNIMIEFAKLHVEAALKEASKEVKTFDVYNESCGDLECKVTLVKKDSILNAYPLENIK